ncbi:MAG: hypothetical protein HUK02_08060, partial [Bacteroidaceae bacterium]|nr:hypothetical protein [Bacteroidaceae bacterium]
AVIDDIRAFTERRDDSYELQIALARLENRRGEALQLENRANRVQTSSAGNASDFKVLRSDRLVEILKYQRRNFGVATKSMQNEPITKDSQTKAMAALVRANEICPVVEDAHIEMMQAAPFVVDLPWETERDMLELYARRASSISQYRSVLLFQLGVILRAANITPLWRAYCRVATEYSVDCAEKLYFILMLESIKTDFGAIANELLPDSEDAICALSQAINEETTPKVAAVIHKKGERIFNERFEAGFTAADYCKRAIFRKAFNSNDKAEEDFKRAIELSPESPEFRFAYAMFLFYSQNDKSRLEDCLVALKNCRDAVQWRGKTIKVKRF